MSCQKSCVGRSVSVLQWCTLPGIPASAQHDAVQSCKLNNRLVCNTDTCITSKGSTIVTLSYCWAKLSRHETNQSSHSVLLQKRFGIVAAVAHLSSAQTEAHRQKYGSGCKAKDESLGSLGVRPLKTQVLQLKCVSSSLPQLVLSFRLCSILLWHACCCNSCTVLWYISFELHTHVHQLWTTHPCRLSTASGIHWQTATWLFHATFGIECCCQGANVCIAL